MIGNTNSDRLVRKRVRAAGDHVDVEHRAPARFEEINHLRLYSRLFSRSSFHSAGVMVFA